MPAQANQVELQTPRQRTGLPVAGLFAGIGGLECGLRKHGHKAVLLSENWPPAKAVLAARFDADVRDNVLDLSGLPHEARIVTAGFPCQDLSQAGRTAGIDGSQSGLVSKVFDLVAKQRLTWLVLENVQFMLQLDRGKAMSFLVSEMNSLGYRWAYRVVDSRFTGVPQRRRRVIVVASPTEDPRGVLFADDAGEPPATRYRKNAYGFYWTEGLRGLGWAQDAVPTLKGGSTVGIPSPPAVWFPRARPGRRFIMPNVEDEEGLQGFERGWTVPAEDEGFRRGIRHKLIGNAVTTGVADWLGERLGRPGDFDLESEALIDGTSWPRAAWGDRSGTWAVSASEYPRLVEYTHLMTSIDRKTAPVLSHRGASGFLGRLRRSNLRRPAQFEADLEEHIDLTA